MKIKEEELKTIQEQQAKLNELVHNIGLLESQKHGLLHEIAAANKDIEEYKKTSEKIFTELKKIESYELDLKIQEYREEIKNFNRIINSSDNNEELLNCSNKINLIIKGIKSIVETIQADEYELAKKNEQVKILEFNNITENYI